MSDPSLQTTQMLGLFERMDQGDPLAQEALIRAAGDRMERLARKMLRRFPAVSRHAETGDVFQSAMVRLLRALKDVRPTSTRHFFALATEQIRRELIDLARYYSVRPQTGLPAAGPEDSGPGFEPPDNTEAPAELERWRAFHAEVEKLPVEEREVVGLIFYHGWSQQAVADLFQVTVRTVQRRWQSALVKLHQLLQEPK